MPRPPRLASAIAEEGLSTQGLQKKGEVNRLRSSIRLHISALMLPILLMTVFLVSAFATPVQAKEFKPHLVTLGFDSLGEPGNGLNSEIVIDIDEKFAYVGSITFDPTEPDRAVKAVDISDPTNPTMTDAVMVQGDFGPFDVKIAGDILAASSQGPPPSFPGITLMDISARDHPMPVSIICAPGCASAFGLPTFDLLLSPDGSHNSFLWADPLTDKTWLFATGLDLISLQIFDVTVPSAPALVAWYHNGLEFPFVHDNFVQENDGRVLEYQAGVMGVEILDVTNVVRGGFTGPLSFAADVVGWNHYTSDPADAATVTRPGFAHYIEPTPSGQVTWVGDEAGCGRPPAIVRSLDSSNLPMAPAKKFLPELGTIIQNPDPMSQCAGRSPHAQTNVYRFTGHNFDVWSDDLLIRGDYGRGVNVYDISDPTAAVRVAKSQGLNQLVGEENKADPGREKTLDNYPWIWQAVYDGDLIYASNIPSGIFVLDLVER